MHRASTVTRSGIGFGRKMGGGGEGAECAENFRSTRVFVGYTAFYDKRLHINRESSKNWFS